MYIPVKMKVNRFRLCNIPANRDLFARIGFLSVGSDAQYTGEDSERSAMTKIEEFETMQARDKALEIENQE